MGKRNEIIQLSRGIQNLDLKVKWQNEVTTLVSTAKRIPVSFALISTYASFVKDKFQSLVRDLPMDTIFVAMKDTI